MRKPASIIIFLAMLSAPALKGQLLFGDGVESGDTARWSELRNGDIPDAIRYSDFDLRDPHLYIDTGFPLGCQDVTDQGISGVAPSFNEQVETAITTDDDGDGFLDSSTVLLFRPFNGVIVDGALAMVDAECSAPMEDTQCGYPAEGGVEYLRNDGLPSGPCPTVLPGTTSGYSPAISEPTPECVASRSTTMWMEINGALVPLQEAQVVFSDPAFSIDHVATGLFMGFLRESDADAIPLPDDVPFVGGQPLSSILPGGTNCCAPGDDRDQLGGESGWWFYFNWVGDRVNFSP